MRQIVCFFRGCIDITPDLPTAGASRLPIQEAHIEQAEPHQGACEDHRTVVGTHLRDTCDPLRHRLHLREAPKKDPLKQIMRSYFPMEEEKDNRVYGAMDGAIRGNMFRQVQQR
ncbi:hypothetical protein NJ76_17020, partial [Rhodococcus sp. IITR03]